MSAGGYDMSEFEIRLKMLKQSKGNAVKVDEFKVEETQLHNPLINP